MGDLIMNKGKFLLRRALAKKQREQENKSPRAVEASVPPKDVDVGSNPTEGTNKARKTMH